VFHQRGSTDSFRSPSVVGVTSQNDHIVLIIHFFERRESQGLQAKRLQADGFLLGIDGLLILLIGMIERGRGCIVRHEL
jgi:hypothetical protein